MRKRNKVNAVLRESEQRYKMMLELMSDYIFKFNIDAEGHVIIESITENFYTITGWTIEDVKTPDLWTKVVHPDDLAQVLKLLQEIFSSGQPVDFEYRMFVKGGELRWVHIFARPEWDEKKQRPIAIVGAFKDITERKLAEEALRASEEKYRALVEQSLQGLVIVQNFQIVFANTALVEISGYTVDELLSLSPKKVKAMVHPEDQALTWGRFQDRLAGKSVPSRYECRGIRKNGTVRWIEMFANVIDYYGKPAVQVALRDITERKQTEQEIRRLNAELEQRIAERTAELEASLETLKRAQKQLVESEKMAALGSLVAGIAHEINTPIGVGVTAASYLELQTKKFTAQYASNTLKRSDLEQYVKVAQESATIILGNLNRAAHLIRSFKQVAVDRSTEEQRRFKLKEYLDDILLSLRPHLKKTKPTVMVNCPENLELTSYPGSFSQILSNLIMNSLIHGFDDYKEGEITIDVSVDDTSLHISYHDNGKGISDTHLPRIFDPFFTTKRTQNNTGLGMHIVYNLITQQLNGTISCESTPGKGTTFSIEIPVCDLDVSM
jgi:PAS domain S-box-containing protein